tara:strand:- start:987 stop:1223 length:237 start_codon:yes stop_codon:yes gene_type:complete
VIENDSEQREEALRKLCIGKVKDMDLGNHQTAWNALKNLPSPHKENLKRMGYSGEKTHCSIFRLLDSIRVMERKASFQ